MAISESTNPRTAVRDVILAGVSAELDADAVEAVEDVSVSSTEMACKFTSPLPAFEEYMEMAL